MRKLIAVTFLLAGFAGQATATEILCPDHSTAICYWTGQVRSAADGSGMMNLYKCSCGDSYWVKQ